MEGHVSLDQKKVEGIISINIFEVVHESVPFAPPADTIDILQKVKKLLKEKAVEALEEQQKKTRLRPEMKGFVMTRSVLQPVTPFHYDVLIKILKDLESKGLVERSGDKDLPKFQRIK